MDASERERYSRQILFTGIGVDGQERLLRSHAVVFGCGALGTFQAAALARAGVGRITIIDRDYVEPSNLHRQWLFEESDAADGLPKAAAAQRRIAAINSGVRVEGIVADVTAANAPLLLARPDLILDGTDNFEARYLINDYCVSTGVPWIYGAAVGSYGISMPVIPGRTACFRCIYPDPPEGAQPTCETSGVLNVIISLIASVQVSDALKILCGRAEQVQPRITMADVWNGGIRQVPMPDRDPDCPACAQRQFHFLEQSGSATVRLCGRNAVQIRDRDRPIDLIELKARLEPLGEVRANEFALRFRMEPYEMTVFPDGRAIVKGTADPAIARSFYARYLG